MSSKEELCVGLNITGKEICKKSAKSIMLLDPAGYIANDSIKQEDLIVYASLVARVKPKSLVIKKEEQRTIEINFIKGMDSSPGQAPVGTSFLTTNWTKVGSYESQIGEDLETFGMTNIDISFNASFTPKIVIEFVDVRGATLFEQGSCSPYAAFFHQPYPIFELTVKGYYGRPVTYYLALEKFNTNFDPASGNYNSTGEFIGYTYAFLSDVLMGYVFASPYMKGASEKLVKIYEKYTKYNLEKGFEDPTNYFFESGRPTTQQLTNTTEVGPTVINTGKEDVYLPITITGNYSAKGLGADALHSFDRRASDKFGGYMFKDEEVPSTWKSRVNVGTQGGKYAGKGVNYVLKDLISKNIKPEVSKIDIKIDWVNYDVTWSVTIGLSTDNKAYYGVATRGSIGDTGSGTYIERADAQIPQLKNDNTQYTNWKEVYLINDSENKLKQYFLAYTLV